MPKSKITERELGSLVVTWFNEEIKRNKYPFELATNEVKAELIGKNLFGDIVIWEDFKSRKAYSYIELKPPFGAHENLDTFKKKAQQFKVKYAFTWDFQNFNAYEIKSTSLRSLDSESQPLLNNIDEILRGDIQQSVKSFIRGICEEIVHLNDKGKLRKFKPEKVYFVNFVRKTVESLIPKFEEFYSEKSRQKEFKDKITAYAKLQGIELKSHKQYYELIARQSVYALVTKIIFYLTLRRYFDDLPEIYTKDDPEVFSTLKISFAKAREKDWQAVFVEEEIEELGFPDNIYEDIVEFLAELRIYHFGLLAEDVVGELFEEIIDPEKRHDLGQYFTNENLVDLILGIVVKNENGIYCDPTCGSGTFLIRLYDRLKYLSRSKLTHLQLLEQIWGIDRGKFPAELATVNLFRQDIGKYENFPRIRRSDIFDVNVGDEFDFPPPKAGKKFNKVKLPFPQLDGLVGNFPFIRQELIEKEVKNYKKYLTKVIAKNHFFTYPDLFRVKNINENLVKSIKSESTKKQEKFFDDSVDNGSIQLALSGQADIYAYIYLHTAAFLKEGGRFGIITSNSWLDVSYGTMLKKFFLDNFKVVAVIASWAEPWFEDAAVNTVITVLEKCSNKMERDNNKTRFVKLKKKLHELIPYPDLRIQAQKRWQRIDDIVHKVENAEDYRDYKQVAENISSLDDDEMRVRVIEQKELSEELKEKEDLSKWGKYLRAPDVYFEILDKCSDKLVPLKEIADVRRGYTTGINEFFYLEKIDEPKDGLVKCRNSRGWEGLIEEKFLRKVIKSPKESKSIKIDPDKLRYHIFICNKSKTELRKAGDLKALNYIEWGETQRTTNNVKWTDVPSVSGRVNWYQINEKEPGTILLQMINNDRFVAFINDEQVQVDHNLFEVISDNNELLKTLKLYLNSTLFALIREVNSRVNLGDGATKTEGVDWKNLMFVPKNRLSIDFKKSSLFNTPIRSIDKEIRNVKRRELDKKIAEALGVDEKILNDIYRELPLLINERLELPKMRKKKQKEQPQKVFTEIKESVIKDCLPEGLRGFPEAFYESGEFSELKFNEYSTNGKPLKSDSFFNDFLMKDESGEEQFRVDSENKAEYAELISRKEMYVLKIPKEEKALEEILLNYRKYIKELKATLIDNSHSKTHDWNEAEKMAQEILTEFGL